MLLCNNNEQKEVLCCYLSCQDLHLREHDEMHKCPRRRQTGNSAARLDFQDVTIFFTVMHKKQKQP